MPTEFLACETPQEFLRELTKYLEENNGTFPAEGYPFPWENSSICSAYAFLESAVFYADEGHWIPVEAFIETDADALEEICSSSECKYQKTVFPNLSSIRNVARNNKSGLISLLK